MVMKLMEMKAEWKYVLEGAGGQYVMICGTIMMQKWFASNLVLEQQVYFINPRCACAAKGYCSRSVCRSASRSVCLFVHTFSLEPWLWLIPNVVMHF